jgi:hypothetical protein
MLIPLIFLRKKVPLNYALLFGMTVMEAFMVASLTAGLTPESVLVSIEVLALTLLALFGGALSAPSVK